MVLNTSLTLCMEIVFPGGGGSGRSPFESAAPGEGLRGVWVCRDRENRVRIVVDGVVKDVDTGGGWGTQPVLFSPLGGLFPCFFKRPRASEAGRGATAPGVALVDGFRRFPASGPVNAGIWALPGAGTLKNGGIRRPHWGRFWPVRAPDS